MDIQTNYGIDGIIREMEGVLQIDGNDYQLHRIDEVIQLVRARISRAYQVDLSGDAKVNSEEYTLNASGAAIALFIESIVNIHARFCGLCQISRFNTSIHVSLSNINFLGFTEDTVKTLLRALQRKSSMKLAIDGLQRIKENLATVSTCREKRLLLIMIIAYEIGLEELTASIAEYLYLSCVV